MSIQPIADMSVWQGRDMVSDIRWQQELSAEDLNEIDNALEFAKSSGADINNVTAKHFPLSQLKPKLDAIGGELESGVGFARIKGLEMDRWNRKSLELIWMGLCSHMGVPVYQNSHGQLLRRICAEEGDVGVRYGQLDTGDGKFLSSRARTASSAELRFHTDRTDIVGLLCTGKAESGGLSRIASSTRVHNAMLESAPDLCQEFYSPLPRSRVGEEIGGETQWYWLPVWGVREQKFTSHYSRTYVESLQHIHGAPEVTDIQWQAMDMLANLADEFALDMELEPGDIQFLNNHVIYHSRSSFVDNPATGMVRSLYRVWLSAPHRALPESHKVLWGEVEAGRIRGGIGQT